MEVQMNNENEMQDVIRLNPLKKGADNAFHKIEIPVTLSTAQSKPT